MILKSEINHWEQKSISQAKEIEKLMKTVDFELALQAKESDDEDSKGHVFNNN